MFEGSFMDRMSFVLSELAELSLGPYPQSLDARTPLTSKTDGTCGHGLLHFEPSKCHRVHSWNEGAVLHYSKLPLSIHSLQIVVS